MDDNEKLVRGTWEYVWVYEGFVCIGAEPPVADHAFNSWQEAVEFTRKRLAEIAERERDIAWLSDYYSCLAEANCFDCGTAGRILAREQAALAELRRGMKGTV